VPDISVKDQVKKLVELQKVDGEIYDLKKRLKENPTRIEVLKNQFESTKAHLHELEENAKNIQVKRKDSEIDLQAREDDITKANTVLATLKTNKEYQAKITEIENIKADKSILEEKILESYDESDVLNAEIEKEKSKVAEEEKVYLSQKKEVEDEAKVAEDRIKVLEGQRNQGVPEIDGELLKRYEKILENKNGCAIVSIQGMSCGGCYMNITAQMLNAIKMQDNIISCEMCTRILYIEDDH